MWMICWENSKKANGWMDYYIKKLIALTQKNNALFWLVTVAENYWVYFKN